MTESNIIEKTQQLIIENSVIKASVIVLAIIVFIVSLYIIQPTGATVDTDGISAENVHINSTNGEVQALYMKPNLTGKWKNIPKKVHTVEIGYIIDGPRKTGTVEYHSYAVDTPTRSGKTVIQEDRISLLQQGLEEKAFEPKKEGVLQEQEITVIVSIRLLDEDGDVIYEDTDVTASSFKVVVTDLKSAVTVKNQLNTGSNCIQSGDVIDMVVGRVECL